MKLERFGEFRVLSLRETAPEFPAICDTPQVAAQYWREHIANGSHHNPDVESLYGLCVSTRRKIQGHFLIAQGTVDTILCHPLSVFRPLFIANSPALILMHNHPSGDPSPSEADIKVTRDMIKAATILKLSLLDHVIMGTSTVERPVDWVSLRELGYFYS